jgi:hypothetical protein
MFLPPSGTSFFTIIGAGSPPQKTRLDGWTRGENLVPEMMVIRGDLDVKRNRK